MSVPAHVADARLMEKHLLRDGSGIADTKITPNPSKKIKEEVY